MLFSHTKSMFEAHKARDVLKVFMTKGRYDGASKVKHFIGGKELLR